MCPARFSSCGAFIMSSVAIDVIFIDKFSTVIFTKPVPGTASAELQVQSKKGALSSRPSSRLHIYRPGILPIDGPVSSTVVPSSDRSYDFCMFASSPWTTSSSYPNSRKLQRVSWPIDQSKLFILRSA